KVTIQESEGLSQVANETQHYVVTNPPIRAGKQGVHQICVDAQRVLEANGELYDVIQTKQGMPAAKQKREVVSGSVESINNSKGSHIVKSVNSVFECVLMV
ncbi:methyltransferase, partial [Staphylococcus pseudintermedius]|uniref:methyltransferase n=1 Tax=Staphylococcus pseudintermedius TaxID=283734 RepID=UPI000E390962